MMTLVVIKMVMMTMMTMTAMTMTMTMTVMMMTAGSAVARYGNAAHAGARRANRDIPDDALKEIGPFSGFGSSFNHHPHTTRCTWILGCFHHLGLLHDQRQRDYCKLFILNVTAV